MHTEQDEITTEAQREMLDADLAATGLTATSWGEDAGERRLRAVIEGKWCPIFDDEERGLFTGTQGDLFALVVGAPRFHNVRVVYYYQEEELDTSVDVTPFEDVEPAT